LELYSDPDLKRDIQRMRIEERNYGFRLVSPRDEHGHGDLGSAFALAMLAASEIAAEPVIHIGPLFGPGVVTNETPFEQAIREFRERQAEYEREQQQGIENMYDDRQPLREFLWAAGRGQLPF
jgi:hypothetical protein